MYPHDACPAHIAADRPGDTSANTSNLANPRRLFPPHYYAEHRKAAPGVLSANGTVVA
jgi:hypothetical protein